MYVTEKFFYKKDSCTKKDYFKNNTNRYLENKENAYLAKKTPRASSALRQALDPGHLKLTSFAQLHFTSLATLPKQEFGPPLTAILGPPL